MRTVLIVIGTALVLLVIAGYFGARGSDGPIGPIPGGPLTSGELVTEARVDWLAATEGLIESQPQPYFVEFELEESATSRTTGILLLDGEIYIPCDLGFGWARFSGLRRWILHGIYLVKSWHERASLDGRAVLRMGGTRYARQAVRVTDPERVEALRRKLEALTEQWVAPEPLAPRPTEGPRDVWFFRLDPRPVP